MKKILSLVLVLVLVLGSMPLAFADEATPTAGETLKAYGLVAGMDAEGNLGEDLQVTRAQMIKLLETLLGEEAAAAEFALPATFTDVAADAWYAPYVAYAELMGYTNGMGDGTFAPEALVSKQMVATYLLRALGYVGEDVWATAEADALALGIDVTPVAAEMTRGEAFDMMLDTLDVPTKDTEVKLGAKLAIEDYTTPEVPEVTEVAVETAVALNSKVVEVALDADLDAPASVDASVFTVAEGTTAVEVVSAEFAGWDTDNYTVLVTLGEDLAAGTLYTLTSGDATADFGGLAADETKPALDSATSTEYSEVTVTMTEAFDISTVTATVTEKYGDKDELAVLDMAYGANDELVLTTADQADATLYEVEIDGLTDLAGNVADNDLTVTFTGQEMNDSDQTVGSATGVDSVTVDVTFDVNVDVEVATDAANYTITEKYGDQDEVVVASAAMKLDAADEVIKNVVRLTLATDTAEATLYELEVANVGTLYGKSLDSGADSCTFTGKGVDADEPSAVTASSSSNTEVVLTVTDDSEIAAEDDASLFTIAEKYGDKDELTVIAVKEVDTELKTITLTTSVQAEATLYELTVAEGLADKFGNVTTDELTCTFTGSEVADEILAVTAVNTADGKVKLTFDQHYGTGALSVASYSIDGEIGYPTKVEEITGNDYAVLLTVSELTVGDVYEVTVNNVSNSDGVAMDADGITDKFSAQYGDSDTSITLEAVVATDNQTLKLYFSKDVADLVALVDGSDELTDGGPTLADYSLQYKFEDASEYTGLTGYAYEDPSNDKIMIVTTDIAAAFNNTDTGADELVLKVNDAVVTNIDVASDANIVAFAENTTAPDEINIDGIVALDSKTLKVYFDQTVRNVSAVNFAKVVGDFTDDSITADENVTFDDAYSNNDAENEWIFVLAKPMLDITANEINFVVIDGQAADIDTHSAAMTIAFDIDPVEDLTVEFSKNTTSTDYMDEIGVVMLDSKTVKVFFPEDMNIDQTENDKNVLDVDAYIFHIGTATTTAAPDSGNGTMTSADIQQLVWNDADNTVTVTLNDTFGDNDTTYTKLYLEILTSVENKAGNKFVKTDATAVTAVVKEYSVSTADAADIEVTDIEADAELDTVTITLNQPLTLDNSNLINGGANDYADAEAFTGEFVIKIDGSAVDYNDIISVEATNLNDDSDDALNVFDHTDIVVKFVDGIVLGGKDVEVSVSDSETSPELTGLYNSEDLLDDSDAIDTVVADTTAPDAATTFAAADSAGDSQIDLTWDDMSAEVDLDHFEIYYNVGSAATTSSTLEEVAVLRTATSYTFDATALTNGDDVHFAIYSVDKVGNKVKADANVTYSTAN